MNGKPSKKKVRNRKRGKELVCEIEMVEEKGNEQ